MKWQIRIQDPSGEERIQPLRGAVSIGRMENSNVILRDPGTPKRAALIWAASESEDLNPDSALSHSPFWIRVPEGAPSALLGDLEIREAHVPSGVPVRIGDTRLRVEPVASELALPDLPSGVRPWLTRTETGRRLLWMAKKAAATPLSLYIAGETGTGKEVIAELLHSWSERASGPFVPLHCGALALSLAESELFGHVKGAFTGASHHRPGALMQAHGGTLFLDEVGDLPLDIQVKLLRFLENGEIRPVGADRPSRADVRLLCATHLPLQKLVEEGKFRRDLYYRLASVTLELPSLRSRPEDIEMLAHRFTADLGRTISSRAMLRLKSHSWPGNVRELRHAIERAGGLAGPFSRTLTEESFEFLVTSDLSNPISDVEFGSGILTLKEMERVMLLKALKLSRGNRAQASKILGIARSTLFEMMKRHGICGPRATAAKFFEEEVA
jgi:DNA-binding NtrC family response regulator